MRKGANNNAQIYGRGGLKVPGTPSKTRLDVTGTVPVWPFMSGETYWNKYNERPWVFVRIADGMTMPIGAFYVPEKYRGTYWRCDLHARFRPDGKQIAFNSVHEGTRQVYVRDVSTDEK